jgi:hypothetical protein
MVRVVNVLNNKTGKQDILPGKIKRVQLLSKLLVVAEEAVVVELQIHVQELIIIMRVRM